MYVKSVLSPFVDFCRLFTCLCRLLSTFVDFLHVVVDFCRLFWISDFEEGGAAELGGGADDSVLTNPEQVDVPGGGSVSLSASC